MTNTHSYSALLQDLYTQPTSPQLFPISINWQQGQLVADLITQYHPNYILELGSGFGISSLWIQSATTQQSTHCAVDPWATHLPKIKKALKHSKYRLETDYTSQEYLAQNLTYLKGKLDFVLMDADNRFDGCMTDCYFTNQALKTGGVLVLRNSWNPSVRRVVQFMLTNLPYELASVPRWVSWLIKRMPQVGRGWLLYHSTRHYSAELCVLVKTAVDNRAWNHFKPFC